MTFLVDVNVLSEPTKSRPSDRVLAWLRSNRHQIAVDPIVMGEIWQGIVSLPHGHRRTNLTSWFNSQRIDLWCIPWDLECAIVWAEIREVVRKSGFTVEMADTMIAATAKLHGLTVATRNVTDFTRCGVAVVNPFE